MPVAAAIIPALAIGAGGVASAFIGSNAAGNAAQSQLQASTQAGNLQAGLGQEGLNMQELLSNESLANQAPWLQSGGSAMANLDSLLGISPSTFNSTPVPGQGPVNFGNTTLSPNSPNPISTTPGSLNGGSWLPQGNTGMGPLNGGGQVVPMSAQNAMVSGNPGGTPGAPPGAPQGPSSIDGSVMNRFIGSGGGINPVTDNGNGPQPFPGPPDFNGPFTGGPQAPGAAQASPQVSMSSLVNPSLGGFGSLMQGFQGQFQAPTEAQAQATPGFQFQMDQGLGAMQNSAAARGALLGGGTMKSLAGYAQGLASTDYANTFNQGLTQYQTAYNQFQQNQSNQYNRLANIAGLGQVSAGQLTGQAAQTGNSMGNLLMGTGQNVGNSLMAGGNAAASGYVNSANAVQGGIGNLVQMATLLGQAKY
jgi:hypothetical protein